MKTMVIGSAAMGLGVGAATFWTVRQLLASRAAEWIERLMQWRADAAGWCAIHAPALPWSRNRQHAHAVTYFMKPLHHDPRTGVTVMLVRYPPGELNPLHRHSTGHGMYVLRGTLVTQRGRFGPETFVWFPPGEPMTHGAAAEEELVALFVTGRALRTEYLDEPGTPPDAPAPRR